jgi:hypothetical protein
LITINTDKGLVKVNDWQDILERSGFDANLNPNRSELKTIIGRYVFGDKVKCGLSICHTPHAKGYLVTTKDGRETNIGKDCGKKYFGVDFETLSKKFDRDVAASNNRESLWSFHFQLDDLEEKVRAIRDGKLGADSVYKHSQELLKVNGGCAMPVKRKLTELVKSRNKLLTVQRLATEAEVEDLEAIEGRSISRPHYFDEPYAEIEGLEVLYKENDLRNILVVNIGKNLAEFKLLDIDQLEYNELKTWAKWISTVDVELERAERTASQGLRFLRHENLEKLEKVPMNNDEVTSFKKLISRVATAPV